MDRKQFIDALFARAKDAGFEACEVYYQTADSFNTDVFKGEIIKYSVSESLGLGFRGLYNGKMGYASTQILDADAIDLLVDGARTNAELIENEDRQFLYPGDEAYADLDTFNPAVNDVSAADKIAMARELERLTLAGDARIEQVEDCTVMSRGGETAIVNTLGLDVSARRNMIAGYVSAVARDGEKVNTGMGFFRTGNPADIDLAAIAREAVDNAVSGLYAASAESGKYRVLLSCDAATDMLQTFEDIFSADAAQKGMSLLKGREGEIIAAECVTLMDDPHLPGGPATSPFDDEGVATFPKKVIENGRLTTLLHNLKTAHKQGVRTSGNASRGYSSPVSVSPSNFYFAPSDISPDAMLAKLDNGLMITEVAGLHAGANPISGDFSLSAKGFRVRDGQKAEAVSQITVAGIFYQLLKDIEAVGSDLRFIFSSCGSPSLLITALSVAGAAT